MVSSAADHNILFPRTDGMIERHRLLKSLTAVFDHKLTIICAPPGYGKTTIVGQFIQRSQRPFAWHTLDERERDLPNLLSHALSTLERVAPGIQKLGALSGYAPRELAAVITNYMRDFGEQEFLYVLDDVHLLTGSSAAEAWLQTLVALLPAKCHLILLSRALPNLPMTEMVARREVLAIGQEQLRFSREEIVGLADSFGTPISGERVQDLYEQLEGWPAGTVLALHPLPPELESVVLKGGKGPEALFEALAVGVLQIQPPALRSFLLESSTLTHITPELCETILDIPNSNERFNDALNQRTFLTRVPGGLVYHRLFRQFLQQVLYTENAPRFVSLHLKAAWWYEQHDRIEEAVDHYLTAGQHQFAMPLVERIAPAYYAQGKVETLLSWKYSFNQISDQVPKLSLNCAKVHTDRYDYANTAVELGYAEQGFARLDDRNGLAEVQLWHARCNLQQGNYETAVKQTTDFLAAWSGEDWLRGRALRTLGLAQMRLGDIPNAITNLEAAIPIYRADGDAHALSQLLHDVVITYSQAGRLKEVNTILNEVVALRRSLGSPGALALALNNLGYFYHRSSDYQQALLNLEEGLSVIVQVSNKRSEGHLLWTLGDVKRDLGEFDAALRLYYKALEFVGTSEPPVRCAILLSLSTLFRWQEQLDEASSLAVEAAALAEHHSLAFEDLLAQTISWAAQGQSGDLAVTDDQLARVANELGTQYAQFETLQALACCIVVALQSGNQPLADSILQAAIKLARGINTTQPFAAEIARSPVLATFIQSNSRWQSAFKSDLERLQLAQKSHATVVSQQSTPEVRPTYSLRVWTLGQERIERDGTKVLPSEWRSSSAKELFFYLLLVGPASREELSLNFWPDDSARQVRAKFHTTLYRTRQALGENVVVLDDQRYLVNPELALWCDVLEMQQLIQQAQLLSTRDARAEDNWRKAVALYRGDFLPWLTSEWAEFHRESLQETYIEALLGAANCVRVRGSSQEAISFLKQALQTDPYREDVYRTIMQCYADLGERKQVVTYYHDLKRLLRQELAVNPSQETVSLVERLLG